MRAVRAGGKGQGARGKGCGKEKRTRPKGFDPSDILAALNKAHIRYMVIGGLAAILHGVDRHTWDLDLSVELTVENLRGLEGALKRIGFERRVPAPIEGLADPRTRRLWTQKRNMQVYSFHERSARSRVVDVMVRPLEDFDSVYCRRVVMRARGIAVPVVPVDVLVDMKRRAGRAQDLLDIENLERLRGRS